MSRWNPASIAKDGLARLGRRRFALLACCFAMGLMLGTMLQSVPAAPDPVALKVQGPDTLGNVLPVFTTPPGAGGTTVTMLAQSSANAAASNNVSLGSAANQTTYCTGFQITGGGATAGSEIAVTLSNVVIQTQKYVITWPTGGP